MKYDFDTVLDRRSTYSMKWDVAEHELPMWVADMDFATAPEITAALQERAANGAYGYTLVPDEWYDAYIGWWERRHRMTIEKESLLFSTGVIPILSSCVRKLTTPAEKVVILTPVYNIFFNSILNNGRNAVECPLSYQNGSYAIDFEALESILADGQTTLMIFCNPHNPVGKIWERETLERVGELAWKHGVTVISDEIHCDLTDPNASYIPFASVSEHCRENSITCIAPTKAFNLAGLQTAAAMIPNPRLRHKVWRGINTDEVAEPNVFAVQAAVTAFTKGEAWLDELCTCLYENKQMVRQFLEAELPEIRLVPSQATYLLWLDCSALTADSEALADFIRKETGLYLSDGMQYGKGGECFLRMNIACPSILVKDGLQRLKQAIHAYGKAHA